jgi:hypothetical protein
MAQTGHIELSKAASLAHTWDCPGMGYASHCFCPFSLTARPIINSEFFPISLIAISFKPLVA